MFKYYEIFFKYLSYNNIKNKYKIPLGIIKRVEQWINAIDLLNIKIKYRKNVICPPILNNDFILGEVDVNVKKLKTTTIPSLLFLVMIKMYLIQTFLYALNNIFIFRKII